MATSGVLNNPAVGVIYGPSKLGKTTDCLFSFPDAFYIAVPAALKPSENVVGFTVPPENVKEVGTIADATKLVIEIGKRKRFVDGKQVPLHPAIIVDDFSLLAERTVSTLENRFSGFKLWGALRDQVLEFRDATRQGGMHVVVNCHENPPTTKGNAYIRGGPRLPGRLPEDLPAASDIVLRAVSDASRAGWAAAYRCTEKDPSYITGDRHGVTPDMAPMNIGEILRAAGYVLPRAPGLEWMEAVVEGIASSLYDRPQDVGTISTNATGYIMGTYYPKVAAREATTAERDRALLHVRWVLRDGRDRAILRKSRDNPLAAYGVVITR